MKEGSERRKGAGRGCKIAERRSTVKDPSHSIHRDHSLGLVLVQARAHYYSHNRPNITSAMARCPARRSSPVPHPFLYAKNDPIARHALSSSSGFVVIFPDKFLVVSKFTQATPRLGVLGPSSIVVRGYRANHPGNSRQNKRPLFHPRIIVAHQLRPRSSRGCAT